MSLGLGYDTPTAWDAALRRRQMAAQDAPASAWGTPQPSGASEATSVTGAAPASNYNAQDGFTPTNDGSVLGLLRSQALSDAGARTRGLRSAAQRSSGGDPALAAWGSLSGLLTGQGDAARMTNEAALQWEQELNRRKWQEYLANLQHQWQMEQQASANKAALWGTLGSVGGAALGAFTGGLGGGATSIADLKRGI